MHFPVHAPWNRGHNGSRGDCRLKAATQERRLQAADELHNPANRLATPEPRRLRHRKAEYHDALTKSPHVPRNCGD